MTEPSPSTHGGEPSHAETAERYANALGGVAHIGVRAERAGLFRGPYRRLFTAQVISSLGDWVGFLAITSLAAGAVKSNKDVAVGVVLSARLLPGFFFGAFATALLDRWDRKKVMVYCDIGRGLVFGLVPFVHNVGGLFLASLVLELLTLMWTPAKEASVPNLVPPDKLAAANSASLAAAYGTIVPAAILFPALTGVAGALGHVHALRFFRLSPQSLAIYLDVLTFFVSAWLISGLALSGKAAAERRAAAPATLASTWGDAREGWRYIGSTKRARGVIVGFCVGLIGGGMVVPLGVTFSAEILHKGPTGYGLLELALGLGVAAGVLTLAVRRRDVNHDRLFVRAVAAAGVALLATAAMSNLGLAMLGIGVFGVCAGTVYVLGFTILGESTSDELRGRIFGVFYTLVRLCLLLALALAPFLSGLLGEIANNFQRRVNGVVVHGEVGTSSFHVALPGTRLTLWLGGLIILG
ncbi:MAG: MFS transporter, partial [Acidimicrobiales bacterium]